MFKNLTAIEKIDSFFTELFKDLQDVITWQTFWILIAGIIIGFTICASIYGILLLKSINQKANQIKTIDETNVDDEVKKIILDIKDGYVNETEGLPFKERFDVLGRKIYEVINRIAGVYYPNSKYPLYELNVEELIVLIHYLTNRIDNIFDKTILAPFKKISISQIFKILDAKKKIDDNKAVKTLKKAQVGKIKNIIMTTIKIVNPITWLKKLVVNSTISFAFRKMSLLVVDIVADETNKVYSKKIFNKENQLQYLEIEQMVEELNKEELNA